ncbi:MAG: soluble NSF attachment protein [Olpidium bornovanus]|uniref:Soluble NSF attachment protein n=1 Tax=Olpidium bornovanus TaxID=278681 RepID=A0A8H7ZX86_9FUNG|nr:MAG: soluble NSF attachment protein [Olpidium bornovanus]
MAKADKKANSTSWFGGNKFEEAGDLYAKAANSFKLAKQWNEAKWHDVEESWRGETSGTYVREIPPGTSPGKEAGDAFTKQADMQLRQSERDEAANTYINASKCYKKSNPLAFLRSPTLCGHTEAVQALKHAIEILTERGRFHAAANNQKAVAEIYESDLVDLEKAMMAYETAADWFLGEEATACVNGTASHRGF